MIADKVDPKKEAKLELTDHDRKVKETGKIYYYFIIFLTLKFGLYGRGRSMSGKVTRSYLTPNIDRLQLSQKSEKKMKLETYFLSFLCNLKNVRVKGSKKNPGKQYRFNPLQGGGI